MSAREEILSRVNSRTGNQAGSGVIGVVPEIPSPRYAVDPSRDKPGHFIDMLEQVHGSCDQVDSVVDVPEAAASYLDKGNFRKTAAISPDPLLTALEWGDLEASFRAAKKSDLVSITLAFAGIGETGTIVMVSSATSPVTLNFLPEVNIAVLLQSRLVNTMENLWPLLDKQPRALNFITGPSKTADIEQTIVYGAHGPRHFHVIMVDDGSGQGATGY